ncbi:MAG: serine hydroxymethyltransferase [Patescibacteria group bacterium]
MKILEQQDPSLYAMMRKELDRQRKGAEMIPSENFASLAVLEALGSVLTNKYSEGYPGKRYYGGNLFIDEVEQLAIDRAKQLFGAEHVNVQPLSGAPANIAVYFALLEPGDTVLGMDLGHGGHLTHGHPVTYMTKIFNFVRYKTDITTGLIDYDNLREMAIQHKPKIVLAGFSAYSRELDYEKIKSIADEVGAITMMDMAHIAGLVAGKQLKNPVPIFDIVTTTTHKTLRGPRGGMILCKEKFAKAIDKSVFPGFQGGPHENNIAAKAVAFKEALDPSFEPYARQIIKNAKALETVFMNAGIDICHKTTDNHLLLIDVTKLGTTGKIAEVALDEAGITVNKNAIPDDQRKPMNPSGIRLGTPALTTRGLKEAEMKVVGELIVKILRDPSSAASYKKDVEELMSGFPLYPELD